MQPHRRQPTRLSRPWESPGKNTGVGCRFLLQCVKVKRESEVTQSCPTLSDPMDCSPPGSPVPGILQARTLEWAAIAFSEDTTYATSISHYIFLQMTTSKKNMYLTVIHTINWAPLVAQTENNPLAMQETRIPSLGRKIPWRRKWQPGPVLSPGESRQRSLTGSCSGGHRELDTTE